MKYMFIILLFFASNSDAQTSFGSSFEIGDTVYAQHFFIDTVSNTGNIWQIGVPQKTTFNSTPFGYRAMVTDTVMPYPSNDTSIFYIKLPATRLDFNNVGHPLSEISFYYRMDIDSGDFGTIEYSNYMDSNWQNVYQDQTITWNSPVRFDSSTVSWHSCIISRNSFGNIADSVFFRFTFISDSSSSNRDGWILDNFNFHYYTMGSVGSLQNNSAISLYPNPSSGHIKLTSKTGAKKANILITNLSGQKLYETNTTSDTEDLYLPLPDGVYILRYSDERTTAVKKLFIQQ